MPTTITSPATTSRNPVDQPLGTPLDRPLDTVNESREIERVVVRLQDRYPTLSSAAIHAAVDGSVHAFDGATVRKFVPLLVERLAKERLEGAEETQRREPAG